MPKCSVTLTLLLSDEAVEKMERESFENGWTDDQWVAWLVEDYAPPQDSAGESE